MGRRTAWTITACASALAIAAKALRNSLGPPISIGSNPRPALLAAKRRSSTKGTLNGAVVAVVARTAMRLRFGMSSRRSCTRLPPISASIVDRPVTFPPGRAKLSIAPSCKGAPCGAMTIGIVCVAPMAAADRYGKMGDDDIDIEPDEFFSVLLGAIASRVGIAELDLDVLAFRIAEGVQSAPESISERMRRRRRHQHANKGQFSRLLCPRRERPRRRAPPSSVMNSRRFNRPNCIRCALTGLRA